MTNKQWLAKSRNYSAQLTQKINNFWAILDLEILGIHGHNPRIPGSGTRVIFGKCRIHIWKHAENFDDCNLLRSKTKTNGNIAKTSFFSVLQTTRNVI